MREGVEEMDWEYRTVLIRYDTGKEKDWVIKFANQPPVVGLQEILRIHGADEWELVTLNLERYRAAVGLGQYVFEPQAYRATFKRPLEGETSTAPSAQEIEVDGREGSRR